MNSDFYKYGIESGSDKITHHGYHRFYPSYLKPNLKKILEIGIENMHSVKIWEKMYPSAFIYGFDINFDYVSDNIKIIKGDQSNINDIDKLINIIGNNIDFILDDGSHVPEHQIYSFIKLFPQLIHGGVYIIEDIETSYLINKHIYKYELNYGFNNHLNLINVFYKVLHLLNREFILTNINEITTIIPLEIIDSISTITFGQNCIIIKKKEEYEYAYNNRKYRFG